MKEFWTIMEADKGGMIGGYPRWLDEKGWYSSMEPKTHKKFSSLEELKASDWWKQVEKNPEYSIDHYVLKHSPLTEEERQRKLKQIEELFYEVEHGYPWWNSTT